MRILRLEIENFKGYDRREFRFSSHFNLFIGPNGVGKTSVLQALAVALEPWVGVMAPRSRTTSPDDVVRLQGFGEGADFNLAPQYPVRVKIIGKIEGEDVFWRFDREQGQDSSTPPETQAIRTKALASRNAALRGHDGILPVVAFYGVDRSLSNEKKAGRLPDNGIPNRDFLKRLGAYRNCLIPKVTSEGIAQFMLRDALFGVASEEWPAGEAVKKAFRSCVPGILRIYFDPSRLEVMVEFEGQQPLPVANLSDGQRSMLALVGDLAQRISQLNPALEARALAETPGVVLIDELDLHLHPKWQRDVVESLRTTFPKVQFFATTHSPFIIQTMRPGEVIPLDAQAPATVDNMGIEAIAASIMRVQDPSVSPRYREMLEAAKAYLAEADEAASSPDERLIEYKRQLAERIAPYADNPAYQAFLEMERVARIGS